MPGHDPAVPIGETTSTPSARNLWLRVASAAVLAPLAIGVAYLGDWPFTFVLDGRRDCGLVGMGRPGASGRALCCAGDRCRSARACRLCCSRSARFRWWS